MGDMEDLREEAVTGGVPGRVSECHYVVPGSMDDEYYISLQILLLY